MKNYEVFSEEMRRMLTEKAERAGYRMMEKKVYKVNLELDGISIARMPGQKCQATLYLQDMYHDYVQDMQNADDEGDEAYLLDLIMEAAWDALTLNPENERRVQRTAEATAYLDKVICLLINPQRNQKLLETVPHRQFLDLAVIYRIKLSDTLDAIVTNSLAELIGADEERLYQAAMKNREILLPVETGLMPGDSMVWLTSQDKMYGAGLMMENKEFKRIAEEINQDLYIIPSSIHELILVPAMGEGEADMLRETIWEANRTFIEPEIFLSDTLYYYDREKDDVRIA